MTNMLRSCFAVFVLLACVELMAQGDQLAYMPKEPIERTADDTRLRFDVLSGSSTVDLVLPNGTFAVDLLNARGNLVHQVTLPDTRKLDLERLTPGTWTLRAHTPAGFVVRRFVVLGNAGILWTDNEIHRRKKR